MKVTLKFISPKKLVVDGIRTCWQSQEYSDTIDDELGEKDNDLIKRIINFSHLSTFEHSLITFKVEGISRCLLQELSRHRVGVSPSVESTRYTLAKIIKKKSNVTDYLVSSGNETIDRLNIEHMLRLRMAIEQENIPNDISKYGIVEAYKVTEQISFNFRSFRHFLSLRLSKKALWEIRDLANKMYDTIPEDYLIFFEDTKENSNA